MTRKASAIRLRPIPQRYLSPMRPGLDLLFRAWAKAVRDKTDVRELALSYERLRLGEFTDNDLRRLLRLGAIAATDESIGKFLETLGEHADDPLTLPPDARFFLTPSGVNQLLRWFASEGRPFNISLGKPYLAWDGTVRALYFGGFLVKRLPRHASTQDTVVTAFAELGWRTRIDDPLTKVAGWVRDKRLNNAIRNLNAGMAWQVMEFHGDGSGTGIRWKAMLGPAKDLR